MKCKFDGMFDFDDDGELDPSEAAAELFFLDNIFDKEEKKKDNLHLDDIDYELLDDDEKRELLEDAGLDPDDFLGDF